MLNLAQRRRAAELMDQSAIDADELRRSLRFITRINRLLLYTRATLAHLRRFARSWRKGEAIRILDVASGSADVPRAILRWAAAAGHDVRIVALDRQGATARIAAENHDARLRVVQGDALCLPFEPASFDYCISSMFLHHLDEAQAVEVLREMDRVARRGVIVADVLRHRRAYLWIRLLTLWAGPVVRHDAAASVAQAFRRGEALLLCDRAGLGYLRYNRHFGHRFVLAGQKPFGGDGAAAGET